MYPVSNYAATLLNRDPEILNKTDYVNTELRTYIEQILLLYADAEEGTIFPGLPTSSHEGNESGTLNSAQELYIDTYFGEDGEPVSNVTDISGTGADGNLDGFEDGHTSTGNAIADLNQATGDAYGDLSDAANQIQQQQNNKPSQDNSGETKVPETMGNVDSEGNRSNIGTQDKNEAKSSGSIFSDADDIQ